MCSCSRLRPDFDSFGLFFYSGVSIQIFCASQTLSEKRSAGGTLVCDHGKKKKMNVEGPHINAVPQGVRNRPTPQECAFPSGVCKEPGHLLQKEHRRKRGRRGQDRHLHRHLSWTRKAPNAGGLESTQNPPWPWSARERVVLKTMENYLKKSETFLVWDQRIGAFLAQPRG